MATLQARVIDGTDQQLTDLLQSGVFAGHKLRLIVDPEDIGILEPCNTVRDKEHLVDVLARCADDMDKGMGIELTSEFWEQKEKRVIDRLGPA
jgi:hypothetical protein